ncbi:MAG TPA: response regulator transcription factor [Acidimicrobiales bacterium]|nr:response regulator transcription factor [Acidimicrobiales bacterium]
MAKVLAVDDDQALLRALRIGLSALGHEVATATTGERGISEAALVAPDAIVLDLGLPDLDGMAVCRRIRQWSDVPIIVLSADGTDDRKIAALDGGADDYMTKPFSMGELEARLRVALRHRQAPEPEDLKAIDVGPLHLDLVHQEAAMGGERLDLTAREFALLAFLARHAGKVCTHKMILEAVWGPHYGTEIQYLRVYTYRLRRKLGDEEGAWLRTVPGIGYRLQAPDAGSGHGTSS